MANRSVDRLLAIASPPLAETPVVGSGILGEAHTSDLVAMLSQVNGFYAFESALHVFPSGTDREMSIEAWNDAALWRDDYDGLADGLLFFAEDVFGVQFVIDDSGIGTFDPETGDVETLADDLDSWAEQVLADYEVLTGYPIAHEWQASHGAIAPGQRLVPKVPFVVGGEFDVENLDATDAVEGMKFRANLARQIRDLPEGAQIRFRIVD